MHFSNNKHYKCPKATFLPLPAVYLSLWPDAASAGVTSRWFTLTLNNVSLHHASAQDLSKEKNTLAFSLWLQDLSTIYTSGQQTHRKSWASVSGGSCFTRRAACPSSASLLPVLISQLWSHPDSWLRVSRLASSTLYYCIMNKPLDMNSSFNQLIPGMAQWSNHQGKICSANTAKCSS